MWAQIILDLERHLTQRQIAQAVGLASSGHVCNIKSGRQASVGYAVGQKLIALHKKMARRKAR